MSVLFLAHCLLLVGVLSVHNNIEHINSALYDENGGQAL
jgi:hypothetical protein